MSKIICPECNKTISSFAKECPNCGFPMAEFLQEHNLNNEDTAWVCPKCGNIECLPNSKNPICDYCNIPVVQTDIPTKVAGNNTIAKKREERKPYEKDVANKYGHNQFSEEAYNHRIQKIQEEFEYYSAKYERAHSQSQQPTQSSTPQITCPYCKSTNCKKISSGSRWLSTGLFGLSSKKIGKQWHCNSCGSDF